MESNTQENEAPANHSPNEGIQVDTTATVKATNPVPVERTLSLGEKRVRTNFNVSASTDVDGIKQQTASLIDALEKLKEKRSDPEFTRLIALANTSYENAAMWAVKAITL